MIDLIMPLCCGIFLYLVTYLLVQKMYPVEKLLPVKMLPDNYRHPWYVWDGGFVLDDTLFTRDKLVALVHVEYCDEYLKVYYDLNSRRYIVDTNNVYSARTRHVSFPDVPLNDLFASYIDACTISFIYEDKEMDKILMVKELLK